MAVYWIGQDGNVYVKDASGVKNMGQASTVPNANWDNGYTTTSGAFATGVSRIPDPLAPARVESASTTGTDSRLAASAPAEVDPDAAERAALKGAIKGRASEIDTVYDQLFGNLEALLKSRDADLTTQYGGQRGRASKEFTEALPQIDSSYAAIGSYDSTQRGDARGKATEAHASTQKTIGENEKADRAKLGQYGNETRTKLSTTRDSAKRNVARVDETSDVGALRGFRNDLESNLDNARVTGSTLTSDGQARKDLEALTGDNGRGDAAINALDAVLKSSLPNDVKAAAVQAVTTSAGLSDEEKKRVDQTYGNVYAEQQAL